MWNLVFTIQSKNLSCKQIYVWACYPKDIKLLNIIVKASNKNIGNIFWGLKIYSREHFLMKDFKSFIIFPDICIIGYYLYVVGENDSEGTIVKHTSLSSGGWNGLRLGKNHKSWGWDRELNIGTVWESLHIFYPNTTQCQTTTLS